MAPPQSRAVTDYLQLALDRSSLGSYLLTMTKKGTKATRKFAKSGELKRIIDNRRKHQNLKKIQARKAVRGAPPTRDARSPGVAEGEVNNRSEKNSKGKGKEGAKAVDFLHGEDENHSDNEDEEVVSKGK